MIPKIIHYCWFGSKPKNKLILKCLESWKTNLPEYEIKLWNEENSPMNHPWVKKAYLLGKYAFVADYVRFHALWKEGGIYLDTDMLILKSLNPFLETSFFIGLETETRVSMGIIGTIPQYSIIKSALRYYDETDFNSKTPQIITTFIGPIIENEIELQKDKRIKIYDKNYFYPIPLEKSENLNRFQDFLFEETVAVHFWNKSWYDEINYIWAKEFRKAFPILFKKLLKNPFQGKEYYKNLFYSFKEVILRSLGHLKH
jgi:mannosyltransferase OCH1-like enzyme